MSETKPRCKNLVLDSGPLLSLSPLRGLAEVYLTVPQVLEELKDKRAREHFERLGLSAGVRVEIRNPDAASLVQVIQFAKKTGDYSVLSHADICVLALTHSLHEREKQLLGKESNEAGILTVLPESEPKSDKSSQDADLDTSPKDTHGNTQKSEAENGIQHGEVEGGLEEIEGQGQTSGEVPEDLDLREREVVESDDGNAPEEAAVSPEDGIDGEEREPLEVELVNENVTTDADQVLRATAESDAPHSSTPSNPPQTIYDDPSDDDDGEGEWITPGNVALHKSRALDLLPSAGGSKKKKGEEEFVLAGCMTADFAMQNVLLQMGLNLVGTEGKRIQKVKSWVLRCHACFKICKDNSKQFCPSCGNPTLLRASVTIASADAAADAPVMQIHLKRNFQYKVRGTKYSIPSPKSGSAKTGPGEGLILREDQLNYMRAKKRADGKKEREEQKMLKGLIAKGGEGGVSVGNWSDPDWMPGILGGGGKGRSMKSANELPTIGYGRKNPNERKRRA